MSDKLSGQTLVLKLTVKTPVLVSLLLTLKMQLAAWNENEKKER